MKNFLFFFCTVFFSFSALSQETVEVTTRDALMSLGSRPAFILRFENTKTDRVEDVWKDFVKDNFGEKIKRNRKTKEYTATDVDMPAISSSEFDLYSTIEKSSNDALLTVWFDLGTNFLNAVDNESQTEEAKAILRSFDRSIQRSKADDSVKEEKKRLDDLGDDLKKLQKKNDDLYKDIEGYKEKIRKAEQEIKDNEAEQEKKRGEIDAQEKTLEAAQKKLDKLGN